MKRVVVTGGRDYPDRRVIRLALLALKADGFARLAHGGCTGADTIADEIGRELGFDVQPYPVDHRLDGDWPGAGPRRNERMLRYEKPDVVLALPGGKGTASCCRIANAMGIKVTYADGRKGR